MRIERTQTVSNKQTFRANVVNTKTLTETIEYMERHSNPPKGWYNNAQDLSLTKKIVKALKKHPSKENLEIEQTHRYGELFNARGVISSGKATLIDTEPARSDSIAPVLNIMRRIVDPANKKSFNKLMGEEHANDYQPWWDKNIRPIWSSINERFREDTCFEGNYDAKFNKKFNAQSGEKREVTPTMMHGKFVEYYKIKQVQTPEPSTETNKPDGKIASFFKKLFS